MSIKNNILEIKEGLPLTTKLVAVSKYQPQDAILEAYAAGQRLFGENRPQELKEKATAIPSILEGTYGSNYEKIEWHFIGHLQTNKIKMVLPYATLIHSVDSQKLLFEIEKYCRRQNLTTEVLLELHIAQEESKQGFSEEELFALLDELATSAEKKLSAVKIRGLMSMASFTKDQQLIRKEFAYLKDVFDRVSSKYELEDFNQLSMGMSNDYRLAVEYGSTMVRVGSSIFA